LTQIGATDKLSRFDSKISGYITKISDFMKQEGISINDLQERMDATDGEGDVDKGEFVNAISSFAIPGLSSSDLELLFDGLDINDTAKLNVDEFVLLI
jgi:Ca2+-binding EF-hand superfamily protein